VSLNDNQQLQRGSSSPYLAFINGLLKYFTDRDGKNFLFHERSCGQDFDGQEVKNIPMKCGQSFQFDRASMQRLLKGGCRKLYSRVSDRYNSSDDWQRGRSSSTSAGDAGDGLRTCVGVTRAGAVRLNSQGFSWHRP
jgi:hypothetical protein